MFFYPYISSHTFKVGICLNIYMYIQARNQEIFRAGEFSWSKGTLINNHVQHEGERLRSEKSLLFFPGNS